MPPRPNRFRTQVDALRETQQGAERNMYAYIRDLFIHTFGYAAREIKIDTGIGSAGIPDVNISHQEGGEVWLDRGIIVEAKDESGVFLDAGQRESIFQQKRKYIGLDTGWFVFVDPTCFVVRAIELGRSEYDAAQDVVVRLTADITEGEFRDALPMLTRSASGEHNLLDSFRTGSTRHIGSVRLGTEADRASFFAAMKRSIGLLRQGVEHAITGMTEPLADVERLLSSFDETFGGHHITFDPFSIEGVSVQLDQQADHRRRQRELRQAYRRGPLSFRLAVEILPPLSARFGTDAQGRQKARDALVAETAGLILARILMLRFFEDHEFFGQRKYLCNGGIEAFRRMREYFGKKYPALLGDAYHAGAAIYELVFAESGLDWILASDDDLLSRNLELVMMYLSFFDFKTINEDVLSGVYGQFLEPAQRKRLGEHYTPPAVAHYLVERSGFAGGQTMFDPACGLGTFLIEGYRTLSDPIRRGGGTYHDVVAILSRLRGNDLNNFSAILAQMQVLWNVLSYRGDIRRDGLPVLSISGGFNSLAVRDLFGQEDEFSELDNARYDVVVGNPPYVRPERQTEVLGEAEENFYSEISSKIDLYSLFIYKALTQWVREGGKLAFVVPVSFCDNDDNRALRQLFAVGGRWTIVEVVDLELVSAEIFPDGDVAAMLLVAENRPATEADVVRMRVAGRECIIGIEGSAGHANFDFARASENLVPYQMVFSPDGRILTRVTRARRVVLDKLAANDTMKQAARSYWLRKERGRIVEWTAAPPARNAARWEERQMLRDGAAFRNTRGAAVGSGQYDVFKGENITACLLTGDPQATMVDVSRMDEASLWRFHDILPPHGYAFQIINPLLTCAPFDSGSQVFLNTAAVFFPKAEFEGVPFDFLMLSRVYQWAFAIGHREGILFRTRSHVYPSTVARLPWSPHIAASSTRLAELRIEFLSLSREISYKDAVAMERLVALESETLTERVRRDVALALQWPGEGLTVDVPEGPPEAWTTVHFAMDLLSIVRVNSVETASDLELILPLLIEDGLNREEVLKLPLPKTPEARIQAKHIIDEWRSGDAGAKRDAVLSELDAIVGEALGLSRDEISFIVRDFSEDSSLKRLKATMPYTRERMRGFREGLERGDRFERTYAR
jgi:hypothetical protein